MARYTEAVCRKCRREGAKLFLKGERCASNKCAIDRRNYAPGQHGKNKVKLSEYGLQLRAKQKTKIFYGVSEAQFRKYYEIAFGKKGVTSEVLFGLLETRLDNVAYRMGLGNSRAQARQIVRFGMLEVNGKTVNVASYLVKLGDVIKVRDGKKENNAIKLITETTKSKNVVSWIEMDKDNLTAKIVRVPSREDVDLEVQESLIIELYSKN